MDNPMRYADLLCEVSPFDPRISSKTRTARRAARREALTVRGVVQGVGFRPFVYRLAQEEGLAGFIGNDTGGVTIEIEGPADRIESFRRRLAGRSSAALAHRFCDRPRRFLQNEKKTSASSPARRAARSPPASPPTRPPAPTACASCFDPSDRRYRYPFLNCTNCGPRFTITRSIPYDRPQTSMARFKMCAACQAEYDDPANRRFHAQPNACPVCGPRVWLVARGRQSKFRRADPVAETDQPPDWPAKSSPSKALADSISPSMPPTKPP